MAKKNHPYLPLYVKDFLTDEKLIECSAATVGVYIKIMCIMHRSETYGRIKLKAKYKQSSEQMLKQMARMLRKQIIFEEVVIEKALEELVSEGVCYIEGDYLCQKRMIKDAELGQKRAYAGSKGGRSKK